MSCRFRHAPNAIVILALALSLFVSRASVSVAQDGEQATSPTQTATANISPAVTVVPGGPGFYSQPALAFKPWPSQSVPFSYIDRTLYNPDSVPHAYEAMISLPNGATITNFVVWYRDNDTSHDMWAVIGRAALDDSSVEQIAYVASSGAATGFRYVQDTSINNAVIDQQSYTYWIDTWLPPGSSAGILSFRIDYRYATSLPVVTRQ